MRQSPNNWKDPVAYTITSPKGIDRVIQDIQTAFTDSANTKTYLPWLEKSFGRAFKTTRKRDESETETLRNNIDVIEPSVWQGIDSDGLKIDMLPTLMNDNLNSFSFFIADGTETPFEYEEGIRNTFEKEISLVVWVDLSRIDSAGAVFSDKNYLYAEEVKEKIINSIKNVRFTNSYSSVEILDITDDPFEIFREYSIDIVNEQNLTYPYHGFRFRLNAVYVQGC